ncbi:MAG: GFA family protein [Alphaproteobacteria bacterium]|nr:GFA family protein [Alphaproteobacteria bacterium]
MANDDKQTHDGGCLCGAVRYRVEGKLRPVVMCHCGQCRRWTGHFVAATAARLADFSLQREAELSWYRSSPKARRGFCGNCGSSLFWQGDDLDYIAILAGTLDGTTELTVAQHIFCLDRGDYYDIDPAVARFDQSGPKVAIPQG